MEELHPAFQRWFARAFPGGPTEAQRKAIPPIARGESVLLSSPTGTGKTLAGFLAILSALHHEAPLPDVVRCVYVSPLKALASDVARNLQSPLRGVEAELGRASPVRVALRTGETTRSEREKHLRRIPHVLVTTPESLALVLASPRWRPLLRHVRWALVDEVHALVDTKRGAHLALTLERLERLAGGLQRIGMSATVHPLEEAARFLTGGRPCRIEEARAPKAVTLRVAPQDPKRLFDDLQATIERGRTTLVFTNTRFSAEMLTLGLRERLGDGASDDDAVDPEHASDEDEAASVAPHHGSMSKEARLVVEERLKRAELRCVVASSSLELGVHVDDVDQVVLLGSPRSAARALQRVGRSGHRVGAEARGLLLAAEEDELAESVALAGLVHERAVEPLRSPPGPLDVLAQHLVALGLDDTWSVEDALALTRRAWPYRDLAREDVEAVLRMLHDDARLVRYDAGRFASRGGRARLVLATSGGAIPREELLRVLCDARFVGEVEESFAAGLEEGDVFQLAGKRWRFERATFRSLLVRPARSQAETVPEWRSEGLAASPLLVEATRALLAGKMPEPALWNAFSATPETEERVRRFVELQRAFCGLPRPDEVLVESFVDDEGRRALVVHAFLGRRATECLARALSARIDAVARPRSSEWGFVLFGRRGERPNARDVRALFEGPLDVPLLEDSELYRRRFRHVAERALLLPRDARTIGGAQVDADRWRRLLRDPEHPVLRETEREVLVDALDLPAAEAFRREVAEGRLRVRLLADRPCPSPYGACILHPRRSGLDGARLAVLRDHFERCREWLAATARPPMI